MNNHRAIALAALLGSSVVLPTALLAGKPLVYVPTPASSQWLTYTSEECGFTIRYPSPAWLIGETNGRLNLRSDDSVHMSIRCDAEPMKKAIKELKDNLQLSRWAGSDAVTVNGLPGRRMTYAQGYFDNAGVEEIESIFLQRNDHTYTISWSLGRGRDKGSREYDALCREIVGTFGFAEVKHRDRLSYTDPAYHFSLEYPSDWELHAGDATPRAVLSHGTGNRITVDVSARSKFDIQQWQGNFTDLGERTEFFEHHLPGRHCIWFGDETYLLEKGDNVYIVQVDSPRGNPPEPRKVIDEILNSLTL